jgi:hypothetical protein
MDPKEGALLKTEVYQRKIPGKIRIEEIRKKQRIWMALQPLDKFYTVAQQNDRLAVAIEKPSLPSLTLGVPLVRRTSETYIYPVRQSSLRGAH